MPNREQIQSFSRLSLAICEKAGGGKSRWRRIPKLNLLLSSKAKKSALDSATEYEDAPTKAPEDFHPPMMTMFGTRYGPPRRRG